MYPMRRQKLTKAIHVRLHEGDYEKVKKLADGLALSPSAFLRMKIHSLLPEEFKEEIYKDPPNDPPNENPLVRRVIRGDQDREEVK